MDGSQVFPAEKGIIDWLDIDEARAKTHGLVEDFVVDALQTDADPHTALALRVSPGVGKTRAALEVIARHGAGLLQKGHILFFVPTVDFADEAREDLKILAPDLPAMTFRGRLAANPADLAGGSMCSRPDRIKPLMGKVSSIGLAACVRTGKSGTEESAPC